MWHNFLPFVSSLSVSLVATAATIHVARRNHWLVQPRAERWHRTPVAKFGGVSILLTFSLTIIAFRSSGPLLMVALLTATIGVVGLVDDVFELRPSWKFAAQFVIAALQEDLDPQAALDRGRFRIEGREVHLEPSLWDQAPMLKRRGFHPVRSNEISRFGGGQVIFVRGDALIGGSDARKDGCAAGI